MKPWEVILMDKKRGVKKTKLEQLYEWKKRPFVDKMLDDGESPNQVHKWIMDNGFEISMPTVYTYAKRRKEAIVKGIQMDKVMDKRKDKDENGHSKADRKRIEKAKAGVNAMNMSKEERKQANLSVNKVQSDLELLDAVLQKGYETLEQMEFMPPKDFLKAIELKHKITGGAHNGLTTYGLDEIRLRESARESAMLTILLEFIPEDKHEEVIERMELATKEFYDSIGLGEQYNNLGEVAEEG
jgi:hypothetical protein